MSKIKLTYKRILLYLKDMLSGRERHELEKEVMRDAFEEEAFEGLSQLTAAELENDLNKLQTKLQGRTRQNKKHAVIRYLRLAAAILLLAGIGAGLYLIIRDGENNKIPDKLTEETMEVKELKEDFPYDSLQKQEIIPGEETVEEPVEKDYIAEMTQKSDSQIVIKKEHIDVVKKYEILDEITTITTREDSVIDYVALETLSIKTLHEEQIVELVQTSKKVIKGRVMDQQGNPIPGVSIIEKGKTNGAVSNANGEFALELSDSNSEVSFAFIGYLTEDLKAENIQYAEIIMVEDIVALDEVVVIGYGTVKKTDVTGAISKIKMNDLDETDYHAEPEYFRPVPPDASLRAYKKWIYSQLDYNKFKVDPVKYRIKVSFTVNVNGSISNIEIISDTPQSIKDELLRVISGSSAWKPAESGGTPVEAKVIIRLRIDLDEK